MPAGTGPSNRARLWWRGLQPRKRIQASPPSGPMPGRRMESRWWNPRIALVEAHGRVHLRLGKHHVAETRGPPPGSGCPPSGPADGGRAPARRRSPGGCRWGRRRAPWPRPGGRPAPRRSRRGPRPPRRSSASATRASARRPAASQPTAASRSTSEAVTTSRADRSSRRARSSASPRRRTSMSRPSREEALPGVEVGRLESQVAQCVDVHVLSPAVRRPGPRVRSTPSARRPSPSRR